ncbi:MAG: hypothetical protein ABR564_01930 [Candidatus Dormibacteria bacterium]
MLAILAAVGLARSRSQGCTLPPPVPDLPDRLRATGDFDRPYNVGVERDLEDVATRAAAALHPNLIGTAAERPIPVAAQSGDRHDALVVPLTLTSTSGAPARVGGLVAFLLDCSGRAYFSAVSDVSTVAPEIRTFPPLSAEDAMSRLGAAQVRLTYRESPLRPIWRDPARGGEVAARWAVVRRRRAHPRRRRRRPGPEPPDPTLGARPVWRGGGALVLDAGPELCLGAGLAAQSRLRWLTGGSALWRNCGEAGNCRQGRDGQDDGGRYDGA